MFGAVLQCAADPSGSGAFTTPRAEPRTMDCSPGSNWRSVDSDRTVVPAAAPRQPVEEPVRRSSWMLVLVVPGAARAVEVSLTRSSAADPADQAERRRPVLAEAPITRPAR